MSREENEKKCVTDGCENNATPDDHRQMCLECNPYGDSLVMNNDPEYVAWLNRSEAWF